MKCQGYGNVTDLINGVLFVHPSNKMAAMALFGEPGHEDQVLALPVDTIGHIELTRPNFFRNGKLVIQSAGKTFELHFRKKHLAEWEALHDVLASH